jgi:hypothetical protein
MKWHGWAFKADFVWQQQPWEELSVGSVLNMFKI